MPRKTKRYATQLGPLPHRQAPVILTASSSSCRHYRLRVHDVLGTVSSYTQTRRLHNRKKCTVFGVIDGRSKLP